MLVRSKACEGRGGALSCARNSSITCSHMLSVRCPVNSYHMLVRSKACEERGGALSWGGTPLSPAHACGQLDIFNRHSTNQHVPHAGQIESLRGERRCFELGAETSVTCSRRLSVTHIQFVSGWIRCHVRASFPVWFAKGVSRLQVPKDDCLPLALFVLLTNEADT